MKIKNDKQCEHASAGAGPDDEYRQLDMPVDGSPGLALRVSSDGKKVWTLRYRRQSDGKQRRLGLGAYPDVSLKDAKERSRKERNGVSDGVDPVGARQERRAADTVQSLADQWLAFKQRQGRRPSYLKDSERRIARVPLELTEMKACDVRRIHITAALEKAADRGGYETNAMHRLLSSIFKWGVSEGHLEFDPSAGIKKRFDEEPRTRYFTDDEVKKFWDGVGTTRADEATRIAMRLCLVTGQRPNELVSLRQSGLSLGAVHPQMVIAGDVGKNHDDHTVPLPKLAVELLRRAIHIADEAASKRAGEPTQSEWVFPTPGGSGPIEAHALTTVVTRAGDKRMGTVFGIADAVLYDCKRTVATFLGNAGYPDQLIAILLNHRSAKSGTVTGKHYNHASYLPQKREMIELWASHLESVLGIERAEQASNVVQGPFQARAMV